MLLDKFALRVAAEKDIGRIATLIAASVRELQPEYTAAQREAALRTVFTVDSRLVGDETYFIAEAGGELAGCGGWSFRKTLFGGDHQLAHPHMEMSDGLLDPDQDAAKIRAIFVHPGFARRGLGGMLLKTAEDAAKAAGFRQAEMGSTLAGVGLYTQCGYREVERMAVPVGGGESIVVVRMTKLLEGPRLALDPEAK